MSMADVLCSMEVDRNKDFLEAVDSFLTKDEEVQIPTIDTIFRASSLSDMCPREEFLSAKFNIKRVRHRTADFRTACDIGTCFHDWFRNDVLGPMGVLVGKWKCARCKYITEMVDGERRYKQPKIECPECGKERKWLFQEDEVVDRRRGVSGHCDGIVMWNDGVYMLELKSSNHRYFMRFIKDGLPKMYVDQIQIYMALFDQLNTLVVYQNKETSKRASKYIEKRVDISDALFGKVADFRKSMEMGVVPDRVCLAIDCPRAGYCSLKELCFKG